MWQWLWNAAMQPEASTQTSAADLVPQKARSAPLACSWSCSAILQAAGLQLPQGSAIVADSALI